jgi:hypothetical protein
MRAIPLVRMGCSYSPDPAPTPRVWLIALAGARGKSASGLMDAGKDLERASSDSCSQGARTSSREPVATQRARGASRYQPFAITRLQGVNSLSHPNIPIKASSTICKTKFRPVRIRKLGATTARYVAQKLSPGNATIGRKYAPLYISMRPKDALSSADPGVGRPLRFSQQGRVWQM